jgi:glycosyltransferase involved in cell wall biosynthesis
MSNAKPLVSIITVVYNSSYTIEKTINSVIKQTYDNIEFIVIDGDSNDGTQSIILKYSDAISFYLSENDKGIYDAMNKGIINSSGDWIFFLNSGDVFYDNYVIENVFLYHNLSNLNFIYGSILIKESNKYVYQSKKITKSFFFNNTICHQSAFFHKDAFLFNGLYNIKYKIIADRDWFFRGIKSSIKFKYIKIPICIWEESGFSSKNKKLFEKEELIFRNLNFDRKELFFLKIWHRILKFNKYFTINGT